MTITKSELKQMIKEAINEALNTSKRPVRKIRESDNTALTRATRELENLYNKIKTKYRVSELTDNGAEFYFDRNGYGEGERDFVKGFEVVTPDHDYYFVALTQASSNPKDLMIDAEYPEAPYYSEGSDEILKDLRIK